MKLQSSEKTKINPVNPRIQAEWLYNFYINRQNKNTYKSNII